jgi:hypothetical protein
MDPLSLALALLFALGDLADGFTRREPMMTQVPQGLSDCRPVDPVTYVVLSETCDPAPAAPQPVARRDCHATTTFAELRACMGVSP